MEDDNNVANITKGIEKFAGAENNEPSNDIINYSQVYTPKKYEFSKIIFIILCLMTVGVTIYSMLLMWKVGSVTPLTYLIPAVYTAFATGTGFYFDKAKKENLIKLRGTYGDSMMDKIKGDD